jgi:membrane protease YdiL (CAAX protease family)
MIDPLLRTNGARTPLWGLGSTIAWSVLIALTFVSLQFATLFAFAAAGYVVDSADYDGTLVACASLTTGIVCTALIIGIVRLKKGSSVADYLRVRAVSAGTLFKWLAVTFALIAIADFITVSTGRPIVPEFMQQAYATADPLWLFWIALVVAAPLFEEVFFRGFLFAGLASSALKPAGAIIVTAVVWAVIHLQYDTYEIGLIVCLGLALGAARVATDSLVVPFVMHATMNLVATIETAVTTNLVW